MDASQFFDQTELEALRRHVVRLWGPRVSRAEIARRLSITPTELVQRYGQQLASNGTTQAHAEELITMYHRARGGDAEAALLILVLASFDTPAIVAMLACPGTKH